MTLCARCYVRGNYRAGVSSTDFRRVEISEEVKTEWTDRETLQLLEAIMHYGEDWKKVADHVGGRSAKECVSRFIKLPFGEQFLGPLDSGEVDSKSLETNNQAGDELESKSIANLSSPAKRMRLSPLADASNPIMAQVWICNLVGWLKPACPHSKLIWPYLFIYLFDKGRGWPWVVLLLLFFYIFLFIY